MRTSRSQKRMVLLFKTGFTKAGLGQLSDLKSLFKGRGSVRAAGTAGLRTPQGFWVTVDCCLYAAESTSVLMSTSVGLCPDVDGLAA